jgi:hypothetical protein
MKEVRLNDKMWFGKYKDLSIKDIISRDRMYVESLMMSGKIKYSEKVDSYIRDSSKGSGGSWYSGSISSNRWSAPAPLDISINETPPLESDTPPNEVL